jgi:adenylate kinase family enzyme
VQRVAIVGSGGVGKSTFADDLGRRTGIPVIHLDEHFWSPGWVPTPRDAWADRQADLLSGDRWIADGNYGATLDVRLSRADTVIVLTLPRWRCTLRALRRSLRHRGQAIQAEGCPERLDLTFLRWVWRYPTDSRPRLDQAVARFRHRLTVVELASTAAAKSFLDEQT